MPPHLVVVPWGHASERCYILLAPPCATLWLFVIFLCGVPPHWVILVVQPPYIIMLICVCCILLILVVDYISFTFRYWTFIFWIYILYTWEIYILRCSLICKWTFGYENIEYKKIFVETLRSFVNVLGCDFYAYFLQISMDLACKQIFFYGSHTDLLQGSELVGGDC